MDLTSQPQTLVRYQYLDFTIWDLYFWEKCTCCSESKVWRYPNITLEHVASLEGVVIRQAGWADNWWRFKDDREGAYDEAGNWIAYPVPSLEIADHETERRNIMARRQSKTEKLAKWFVTQILGREWTVADYTGMHMKHARSALLGHAMCDICGCLEALKDGLLADVDPTYITIIWTFEPPLINQWLEYKAEPPPVYLEADNADWLERTKKVYDDDDCTPVQSEGAGMRLQPEDMRTPEPGPKTGRRRRKASVAANKLPELHQGKLLSDSSEG